jgi:hypothetical protein
MEEEQRQKIQAEEEMKRQQELQRLEEQKQRQLELNKKMEEEKLRQKIQAEEEYKRQEEQQKANQVRENIQSEKNEKDAEEKPMGWDEDVEKLIPIIDSLLEKLPEEVINEFANSENFSLYEKVITKYKK